MTNRPRLYAGLLALGASVLLVRAAILMSSEAMAVLALWVVALLVAESVLDGATVLVAIWWWVSATERAALSALRLAATIAFLHAVRLLVFVLGRSGPWIDFDLRPDARSVPVAPWTWLDAYGAASAAALGVVAVVVIWRYRRTEAS